MLNVIVKNSKLLMLPSHLESQKDLVPHAMRSNVRPIGVKFKNKERKLTTKKWFLNKVIKIKTKLTPKDLLEICRKIEKELGRKKTIKWGPRTIDLDILFYGNKIIREKDLIIPHSRAHKRRFVLVPLAEISPGFVHPLLRKKVKTLLESLQDSLKVYKV
ncbi:2-amino-4-hydroxy-6-hydroxymethyldihydropteridine diphosphokinase [bacterium]|nr:2-amino-4-hydroxy-6-hydroxymethyldihydropteridine diphosphokinase [bacterium]